MQKNHNIFLLATLSLLLFFGFCPTTFAITPSPSASASASLSPSPSPTDSEITENLKERLKTALASPSALPKSDYRAIVGVVKDMIQKNLIIETKDGKKQVALNENTTLLRTPGNATIKQDSIRIDDYIIAIGQPKEEDILSARRVIVSAKPLTTINKKTGYGQVTEISDNIITLFYEGQEFKLTTNNKTRVKSPTNPALKLSDIPANSRIIYTAEITDSNNKETPLATTIMLIQ